MMCFGLKNLEEVLSLRPKQLPSECLDKVKTKNAKLRDEGAARCADIVGNTPGEAYYQCTKRHVDFKGCRADYENRVKEFPGE